MMSVEEFRLIPGYTGYRASSLGRIQSCRMAGNITDRFGSEWRDLSPCERKESGRTCVRIKHDDGIWRTVNIATLVLLAFVGPRPDGMEVCHYPDRDQANSRLDNLRWDTRSANMDDAIKHGTRPIPSGKRRAPATGKRRAKLSEANVIEMRRAHAAGAKISDLAEQHGIYYVSAWNAVHKVTWKHVD